MYLLESKSLVTVSLTVIFENKAEERGENVWVCRGTTWWLLEVEANLEPIFLLCEEWKEQ